MNLLDHNLLLLRVHAAFRILRRDGNQCFSRWKRRGEVVKTTVGANNRHFVAIHHHSCAELGLAGQFDHVTMLNKSAADSPSR